MSDNPIKKVSFFEDGELLFANHYPPYQYLWTESKDKDAGFYTMEAIAYSQSEEVIASAKRTVEIIDPRTNWIDDFNFTIYYDGWELTLGHNYDTLYYDGQIRNFEFSDLSGGKLSSYYNGVDYKIKSTVVFGDDLLMVCKIDTTGQIETTYGTKHCQMGEFTHQDSMTFRVYLIHGQSHTQTYDVIGVRK